MGVALEARSSNHLDHGIIELLDQEGPPAAGTQFGAVPTRALYWQWVDHWVQKGRSQLTSYYRPFNVYRMFKDI